MENNKVGHLLNFAAEPISTVRIGFIGVGIRGSRAISRFLHIDGIKIAAVCDISQENIERILEILGKEAEKNVKTYQTPSGWKQLCENPDIDLVYICTDWRSHTPMSVYAMECGKHVAVEVPAATTVEECWQLVETAEKYRRHCMQLENCCYDFFELNTLHMVQKGLLGEIIHGEGAYIHDLRPIIFADKQEGGFHDFWQIKYIREHTGNPYPTHGLGPVCQAMNIHRGDRINYLVSMSTGQFGLTQFAREKYGNNSQEACASYLLGDMNTTLIHTEKGHTIMLQHNKSNPRPYSRIHLLNGTKGYVQKYPVEQVFLESSGRENSLCPEEIALLQKEYEHPFVTRYGKRAIEVADIRARDYIMDSRLIYCLRHGLPLDQDVYDAAEWSSIVALSEKSVLGKSIPVDIPDFTRGHWDVLTNLNFHQAKKE